MLAWRLEENWFHAYIQVPYIVLSFSLLHILLDQQRLLVTCDEAGAGEGGGLAEDCLSGPDVSGGREAASLVTSRGHPQGQTLGVRPVVTETRLRA